MKKTLVIILTIFILATIAIFIFIPTNIQVSQLVFVQTTRNPANQFLSSPVAWKKWFPGTMDSGNTGFYLNGQQFLPTGNYMDVIGVDIKNNDAVLKSNIHILPLNGDSLGVAWKCNINTGFNPFRRLRQYGYARKTHQNMQEVLNGFKKWINNPVNIYGIDIKQGRIQDSVLVSTELIMNEYPSTEQLYGLLHQLQEHYKSYGATQTGMPMLHVRNTTNGKFIVLVAIPISKDIPNKANIIMKHMFKGYTLIADITGGIATIRKSLDAMEKYLFDYSLRSPAVPFQSIITDREKEPDSSKWKTKLYYPIY